MAYLFFQKKTMTDLTQMTDEELDAQVTADVIKDASWKPADPTAKETDKTPAPKKEEAPTKVEDKTNEDPNPKKDWDPEKEPIKKSIETLLAKKNEERRLKNEALKTVADKDKIIADQQKTIDELKNPKDDDSMTDEERSQKLQEAITKKTIAEEKRDEALNTSNSIDTVDETKRTAEIGEFFTANPELLANKQEIMDLANSYPTLPMDQVNKLRTANTDPLKLLSEQDVNKIKWGFNLAWKYDKSRINWKDPKDMSDDELESSLQQTFAGGSNPIAW